MSRDRMRAAMPAVLTLTLALGACSHLPHPHWPFHHRAHPAPTPVNELVVTPAAGTSVQVAQYWQRETLLIDLSAASGQGEITLQPRTDGAWPVRIALRVRPGSVGQLDVRAAQRMLLPVTPAGSHPVDLELPPGVYKVTTPQLTVAWGPTPSL